LTVHNSPEIIDGIEAFCREQDYEIIIANMRLYKLFQHTYYSDYELGAEILKATTRNMMAKQVEGIVYVANHCREIPALPPWVNIPVVFAHCISEKNMYPAVLYDDEKAARDMTEFLVKKGHRRIGVIGGLPDSYHTITRLEGVKKALHGAGIPWKTDLVRYGDWYRESAYNLASELLEKKVTAIFAFNDVMALGAQERAAEKGLVIGKDISLAGFDNRDLSNGVKTGLTTTETPLNAMGRKCAELVIKQIGSRRPLSKRFYLPCTLCERASVGEV
jgi:LacI family transcriptional regulator